MARGATVANLDHGVPMTPSAFCLAALGGGEDAEWSNKLRNLIAKQPEPATVGSALGALDMVYDWEALLAEKRDEIAEVIRRTMGEDSKYPVDYGLAIYVYTLDNPAIHKHVNGAMISSFRAQGPSGLSANLAHCLPFIKLLDSALASLPPQFAFSGRCFRGVKHVFPSPAQHSPETHFPEGKELFWYHFTSTSWNHRVMSHAQFCGHSGPRTIFVVETIKGYRVEEFSHFGVLEAEVLFRPLSKFVVKSAFKLCQLGGDEGFPDNVVLTQLE